MLTVGSLFSGIGGLELGLERAGMKTIWQCERDPYARAVLAKNFPGVPCYDDITTLEPATVVRPDVLCGGFPCQPHSVAGKRRASADDRDLWGEFARIIRGAQPRWVLAENVPGLLSSEQGSFFGRVLGDLADLGFDAEWQVLSAAGRGAPHIRRRVFLVAYSAGFGVLPGLRNDERAAAKRFVVGRSQAGSHADDVGASPRDVGDTHRVRQLQPPWSFFEGWRRPGDPGWWSTEPDVGRVAYGVPRGMDRLRSLGNAVVPQVAEEIGRLIMQIESLAAGAGSIGDPT